MFFLPRLKCVSLCNYCCCLLAAVLSFDVKRLALILAEDLGPARRQSAAGAEGASAQLVELEEEVALRSHGASRNHLADDPGGHEGQVRGELDVTELHFARRSRLGHGEGADHQGVIQRHLTRLDGAVVAVKPRQVEQMLKLLHRLVAHHGATSLARRFLGKAEEDKGPLGVELVELSVQLAVDDGALGRVDLIDGRGDCLGTAGDDHIVGALVEVLHHFHAFGAAQGATHATAAHAVGEHLRGDGPGVVLHEAGIVGHRDQIGGADRARRGRQGEEHGVADGDGGRLAGLGRGIPAEVIACGGRPARTTARRRQAGDATAARRAQHVVIRGRALDAGLHAVEVADQVFGLACHLHFAAKQNGAGEADGRGLVAIVRKTHAVFVLWLIEGLG